MSFPTSGVRAVSDTICAPTMCEQLYQMQCAFEDLQTDFGCVLDIVDFLDDELNDDARVPVRHRILLQALHNELGRFQEMLSRTNAVT